MTNDIDDFLAHYGVKGMRWGVRKDGLTRSRARAVEKDRAWIEDAQRSYNNVATSAAMHLNKEVLPRINAKYAVEGKGVRNSQYDAYINELTKAYEDELDKRMYAAIGRSPSGKHSLKWHAEQADIKLPWAELVYSEKKMAHADTAPMIVRFVPKEDGTVEVEVVSREEFESSTEEVEHSMVDSTDDFLAHYGVKGMKWGVRRDLKGIRGASNRTEYLKKRDASWINKVNANPKLEKIARMVAKDTKSAIKQLNRAYPKKLGMRSKADKARYDRALEETIAASIDRAAYKTHKLSPTRAHEVKVTRTESGELLAQVTRRTNAKIIKTEAKLNRMDERAKKKELAHAEEDLSVEDFEGLGFLLLEDEDGLVVDVVTPFDDLEHAEKVDDFLAHYGVKGMRWGVRKDRSSSSGGRQQKKSSGDKEDDNASRKATKSKNELSRYSDDKLTSMTANLKGPDALSDAELKKLTGRMQLEQTYRELLAKQPKTKSKAEKFLDGAKLLGNTANQLTEFMKSPAGKALQAKLASRAKK